MHLLLLVKIALVIIGNSAEIAKSPKDTTINIFWI